MDGWMPEGVGEDQGEARGKEGRKRVEVVVRIHGSRARALRGSESEGGTHGEIVRGLRLRPSDNGQRKSANAAKKSALPPHTPLALTLARGLRFPRSEKFLADWMDRSVHFNSAQESGLSRDLKIEAEHATHFILCVQSAPRSRPLSESSWRGYLQNVRVKDAHYLKSEKWFADQALQVGCAAPKRSIKAAAYSEMRSEQQDLDKSVPHTAETPRSRTSKRESVRARGPKNLNLGSLLACHLLSAVSFTIVPPTLACSLTTLHWKKLGLVSITTHLTGTTSFAKGAVLDTMSVHYA